MSLGRQKKCVTKTHQIKKNYQHPTLSAHRRPAANAKILPTGILHEFNDAIKKTLVY